MQIYRRWSIYKLEAWRELHFANPGTVHFEHFLASMQSVQGFWIKMQARHLGQILEELGTFLDDR